MKTEYCQKIKGACSSFFQKYINWPMFAWKIFFSRIWAALPAFCANGLHYWYFILFLFYGFPSVMLLHFPLLHFQRPRRGGQRRAARRPPTTLPRRQPGRAAYHCRRCHPARPIRFENFRIGPSLSNLIESGGRFEFESNLEASQVPSNCGLIL